MERENLYECFLSKDGKKLYYLNGKRTSAANVPKEIIRKLPCITKGTTGVSPTKSTLGSTRFRINSIKDILTTWRVPRELFGPLSKFYRTNINDLEILLELFPKKPWDWSDLSANPNITWEFVQSHPDKPWVWYRLSQNPNITWEIIRDNPDKPWIWNHLLSNPNITWEIIQKNLDKQWDWNALSWNPNITPDIIRSNPDIPWDWEGLSRNPNITWEFVQTNLDKPWN